MDEARKLQAFFQAIGDANRLRIIRFVGGEKRAVSDIVRATGLSQPLVSHHLRIMKKNGILGTEREGPFIFYRLKDTRLLDILGLCLEIAPNIERKQGTASMFHCPPFFKDMIRD